MFTTAINFVRRHRRPLIVAYSIWVLFLTLSPLPPGAGRAPWWFDKAVHFGIFVVMAALLYLNLPQERRHHAIWVVGTAVLFAGAIELAQSPLAFRSGGWWDFLWGGVGAAVGWLGAEWVERTWKGRGDVAL